MNSLWSYVTLRYFVKESEHMNKLLGVLKYEFLHVIK